MEAALRQLQTGSSDGGFESMISWFRERKRFDDVLAVMGETVMKLEKLPDRIQRLEIAGGLPSGALPIPLGAGLSDQDNARLTRIEERLRVATDIVPAHLEKSMNQRFQVLVSQMEQMKSVLRSMSSASASENSADRSPELVLPELPNLDEMKATIAAELASLTPPPSYGLGAAAPEVTLSPAVEQMVREQAREIQELKMKLASTENSIDVLKRSAQGLPSRGGAAVGSADSAEEAIDALGGVLGELVESAEFGWIDVDLKNNDGDDLGGLGSFPGQDVRVVPAWRQPGSGESAEGPRRVSFSKKLGFLLRALTAAVKEDHSRLTNTQHALAETKVSLVTGV